jgi:hypothetical protein
LVSDTEDGITNSTSAAAPSLSAITGPFAAYGIGAQTATCSFTDSGRHTTEVQAAYSIVDTTKPTISAAIVAGTLGNNDWYTSDVTVRFTCSDSGSGIAESACPADQVLSTEGGSVSSTAQTVTDRAGNVSLQSNVITVKIDKAVPTGVSGAPDRPADSNGWYNKPVNIAFTGQDATSGIDSCTSSSYTGPDGSDLSVNGTCTDKAGNQSSPVASASFKYDATKPTITAAATISPNTNGWYNGDVTIHFTCTDATSHIPVNTCPADQLLTGEGDSISSTAKTVADNAGNVSDASNVVTVKIDRTKPTIKAEVVAGTLGSNDWYTSNVTVRFTCTDALSQFATGACPADEILSTEGSAVSSTARNVTDKAGNESLLSNVITVKIDKTKPALNITGPASGTLDVCTVAKPTFAPSDSLSGLDGSEVATWTTPTGSSVGTYTYTATAKDKAGNSVTETRTYTVKYGAALKATPFLQPINSDNSSRFKTGSTVPVKFQLLCGTTPITNAVAKLNVRPVDTNPDPGIDEAISTSAATTGNMFRYDASGQQYIFNLSTKQGYTDNPSGAVAAFSQGTWTLSIVLDDGTSKSINVQLVK